MALYHIYVIIPPMDFISPSLREVFRGPPTDYIFRGIHLLFALVLTFLWFRLRSPTDDELAMLLPEARAEHESKTKSVSLLDLAAGRRERSSRSATSSSTTTTSSTASSTSTTWRGRTRS